MILPCQSDGSSAPVVSRCLWPGNTTFLEMDSVVVTWWIMAFLHIVTYPYRKHTHRECMLSKLSFLRTGAEWSYRKIRMSSMVAGCKTIIIHIYKNRKGSELNHILQVKYPWITWIILYLYPRTITFTTCGFPLQLVSHMYGLQLILTNICLLLVFWHFCVNCIL